MSDDHSWNVGRDVFEAQHPYRDTKGRICVPIFVYHQDDGLVLFDGTLVVAHKGDGRYTGAVIPSTFDLTGEIVSR